MTDNEESFEAALLAFEAEQAPASQVRVGEKIEGTLISIGPEFAFVELGAKAEGQLPVEELQDSHGSLLYEVGESVEALVTAEGADGSLALRIRPGQGPVAADELRDAHRHGIPVEGTVSGINKGGAEVEVGGVRAFCPTSQLADRFVEDPSEFLNRKLRFRVTRFEEGGGGRRPNIVLSRRDLLAEEKRQRAEEIRAKLKVGSVIEGEVRSLVSFGAFIDLGGIEGLLHVSEMSHRRVEDPGELLEVGQRLEVEVLNIEPNPKGGGDRISLSIRSLEPNPWLAIEQQLAVGSTVSGTVTRLASFGAFVEIAPGIEGLVHVSELGASERVQHARDVVSTGQEVNVQVLDIDLEKRRISLSVGAAKATATARREASEKADFERRNQASSGGFSSIGDLLTKARQKAAKD